MRINDSSRSIRHLLNLFVRVPRRSKKSLYHKYWCGYIVYNEYSNTLGVSPQRTIYKSQLNTLSGWNSSLQGQFSNLLEYIMEWRIISLSEEFSSILLSGVSPQRTNYYICQFASLATITLRIPILFRKIVRLCSVRYGSNKVL
jgi:hypothetical protein